MFRKNKDLQGQGVIAIFSHLAALLAVIAVILLFSMIMTAAIPALFDQTSSSPLDWIWQPYDGHFGILPMCLASLLLALFAIIVGWPLAFCLCLWLLTEEEFRGLTKIVELIIHFMTTIPTVVYGFVAIFLLTPLVRAALAGSGMCFLTAGLMLIILILPTMILLLEAGLRPRLERLCPFALALGFSKRQILCYCVLPEAKQSLIVAAVLGLGRAIGDTLIPLMLAGNATTIVTSFNSSLRSLTAHMALVTANEVSGAAYNSLFVAGFILLLGNTLISLCLRYLSHKDQTRQDFKELKKI